MQPTVRRTLEILALIVGLVWIFVSADSTGVSTEGRIHEIGELGRKNELRSIPSSYFIDRDGTIAAVVFGGPMSDALFRTIIEAILKSSAR